MDTSGSTGLNHLEMILDRPVSHNGLRVGFIKHFLKIGIEHFFGKHLGQRVGMQVTRVGFPDTHNLDVISLPELGDHTSKMVVGNAGHPDAQRLGGRQGNAERGQ